MIGEFLNRDLTGSKQGIHDLVSANFDLLRHEPIQSTK
jgi:hypothetical protein